MTRPVEAIGPSRSKLCVPLGKAPDQAVEDHVARPGVEGDGGLRPQIRVDRRDVGDAADIQD